jgi:glycosyltransferase involved in cell wall biosynthesis
MRIAFVTNEFVTESYYSGGLANYLYRVSKVLISLGHEAHVITRSDEEPAEFDHDGIQVHRYTGGGLLRWLNLLTRYRLGTTALWLDWSFQAYRKLRQLHKQSPFDIVQLTNVNVCGLAASLLLPVPCVVRASISLPALNERLGIDRNRLDTRAREWLDWLQLHLSQHIFAPSHTLKGMLAERAEVRDIRVIRTPFYLETANWDPSIYDEYLRKKNYLLFFGRFELHKGFHILAQALPQVLQVHPDCHAVFVGWDRPTRIAPCMAEYARSLCGDNADRLTFVGQSPHEQLYPIIAGARLVVLPSLIDNLPNACLEAMALGRPVIGTLGTSFDEIITDGETGFLVPAGDVDALAAKINEAWTHAGLDEIGRAAQCKIQDFAPERTVQELLTYYKEILNDNKRKHIGHICAILCLVLDKSVSILSSARWGYRSSKQNDPVPRQVDK